jgi:hypothetical protein
MSSPTTTKYVQVESGPWDVNFKRLDPGEKCQIVLINGDRDRLTEGSRLNSRDFGFYSKGPFIDVKFKEITPPSASTHGTSRIATVIKADRSELKQEMMNKYHSFYFVVKGGNEITWPSGGRKSRRRKSNKNKRTRRKSVKKHHHHRRK